MSTVATPAETPNEKPILAAANVGDPQLDKTPPDPFDPKRLAVRTSTRPTISVEKRIITVPVRKPNKQNFARVHPGEDFTDTFASIELKDENEMYIVDSALVEELGGEVTYIHLFTAIDPQGNLFLWPVKQPTGDRVSNWYTSHMVAVETAKTEWVKVQSNMATGSYEVHAPQGAFPHPVWPKVTFGELLRKAFQQRLISSLDHPIVKRLQGRT